MSVDVFADLLHADLLDRATADRLSDQQARVGGSALALLTQEPGVDLIGIWAALADQAGRPFLPSTLSASPIDATILTRAEALMHLALARRTVFDRLEVITPDPFLSSAALNDLRERAAELSPDGRGRLTLYVTTPTVWQRLFDLSYPTHDYSDALSLEEACALASLVPLSELQDTPDGLLARKVITAEQHAETLARHAGRTALNPHLHPPDPDALEMMSPAVARIHRLYPHHLARDGTLHVLGAVSDLAQLGLHERQAATKTGRPIHALITTDAALSQLLATLEIPNEAAEPR